MEEFSTRLSTEKFYQCTTLDENKFSFSHTISNPRAMNMHVHNAREMNILIWKWKLSVQTHIAQVKKDFRIPDLNLDLLMELIKDDFVLLR